MAASAASRDRCFASRLRLADRPLVAPGQRVEAGQPIIERFREQEAVEIATTAALVGLPPGSILDDVPVAQSGRLGRRSRRAPTGPVSASTDRDGITRLVAGSGEVRGPRRPRLASSRRSCPAASTSVPTDSASRVAIGWGRPAAGHIVIVAASPDAEVPASRIDVSAAGAILVVGARLDVEAMSRARAIGVAAVVSGGVASRDLRQLDSSEARQQAALHGTAPFGMLAMAGYGRVPIPCQLWDLLVAAEGRPAGIHPAADLLVIGGDPAAPARCSGPTARHRPRHLR